MLVYLLMGGLGRRFVILDINKYTYYGSIRKTLKGSEYIEFHEL